MSTRPHRPSRRSRSPRSNHQDSYHPRHSRSRSPRPHHPRPPAPVTLPFHAQPLKKRYFENYKPMFALYLDIQKQLILEEMDEREVKGRWKRFVGKWNRGELAEGWYEPETLGKAQISSAEDHVHDERMPPHPSDSRQNIDGSDEDEDDDGYGPALPSNNPSAPSETIAGRSRQSGPSIPKFEDLQLQHEQTHESSLQSLTTLRHAQKAHLQTQKQELEALIPRAAPGTKDRQIERKAELRASNNNFAASKSDNTFTEMPEADLMGGDDDDGGGLEGFRKKKAEEERKKNDREIRREEILRARKEEREERVRVYREKEEKTMEGLVALARARFG